MYMCCLLWLHLCNQFLTPRLDPARPDAVVKLRMNIPDTIVFSGEEPPLWLFTNARGEVDMYAPCISARMLSVCASWGVACRRRSDLAEAALPISPVVTVYVSSQHALCQREGGFGQAGQPSQRRRFRCH
jgi:hypothetical protein